MREVFAVPGKIGPIMQVPILPDIATYAGRWC